MIRLVSLLGVLAAAGLAAGPRPARADMSACGAAYQAKDIHQQIDLYTSCLKHGGLVRTDVAGAFNNRGYAYEQLGERDKALQDYISATQYDPTWPDFRVNRARLEAWKGDCAQAVADVETALKMAPHRKPLLDFKARLIESCPIISKPPA